LISTRQYSLHEPRGSPARYFGNAGIAIGIHLPSDRVLFDQNAGSREVVNYRRHCDAMKYQASCCWMMFLCISSRQWRESERRWCLR